MSIFDPKRTWGLIWRSIEGCPGVGTGGCGGSPGGGAGCGGSPGGIGLCLVVVMTAPHLWLKSRETPESRKRQIRCHPELTDADVGSLNAGQCPSLAERKMYAYDPERTAAGGLRL